MRSGGLHEVLADWWRSLRHCLCWTIHVYQYMLFIVAIVDCPLYGIFHYKIIRFCCYSRLHPCRVSHSFLQEFPPGLGNIALANTTVDVLIEDHLQPPLDMNCTILAQHSLWYELSTEIVP